MNKTKKSLSDSLGISKEAMNTHVKNMAPAIAESQDYGSRVVYALQEAIETTKEVIDDARGEQMYGTAINGLKVLSGILETQAKLMGIADKAGPGAANNLHLHLSVTPEEVSKLAEDYRATVEIESDEG